MPSVSRPVHLRPTPLRTLTPPSLPSPSSHSGTVLLILATIALDFAIPLPLEGPNMAWCRLTDDSGGKHAYFPAECVVEGLKTDYKEDKNYLVCYHPHSLYGIGYNLYTKVLHDTLGTKPLFTVRAWVIRRGGEGEREGERERDASATRSSANLLCGRG